MTDKIDMEMILNKEKFEIYRSKVPNGWLVTTVQHGHRNESISSVFIPDIKHDWLVI